MCKCGCGRKLVPRNSTHVAYSLECAVKIAKAKVKKKKDREFKHLRRKYYDTDARHWKKKARTACHSYIRERDDREPCISCGTMVAAKWDAGHFKSRGARSALQFHEANIHKQCSVCNQHRSGNITEYRANLVEKEGLGLVSFLEGPQAAYKWTVEDYKDVHWWYTEKLKWLKAEREPTTI